MREIPITEIEGISIGQAENPYAGTGCTVFLSKTGMRAGLDVRGGGPASRETQLLSPVTAPTPVNAVVLSGGSAFGLAAADGVVKFLEASGIGFDTGFARVPIVVQSDLFDLGVGNGSIRPDAEMGMEAAKNALENPNYRDGNFGAGCGATVGKIAGAGTAMKTGIGSFAVEVGGLKVGAVVALNALGDIFDWKTGKKIAGLLAEDKKGFRSTGEFMAQSIRRIENRFVENTTIGIIITNAHFDKTQLTKIAAMAHNGYARSINPVHTMADGDSIYAVSVGDIEADQDLTGTLASEVMSEAIIRAVMNAESAYGLTAATDLEF
ncbi:MAG: P1 family peptidase [Firmicutes bacterium]|nr:P1 family peptidase [Bacillota bacterium]